MKSDRQTPARSTRLLQIRWRSYRCGRGCHIHRVTRGQGRGGRGPGPIQRQAIIGALGAEDHRSALRGRRRRADDMSAHPHRHQPGHRRVGRGARRLERDVRAGPEEPHPRRKPLQRRQDLSQDQAVRRPRPTGRRRVRDRDGVHGPGRKGVGRAVLSDARRQVPRSRAPLRRHHARRRPEGAGAQAQGADEPRHHVPQAGLRHRAARGQAGDAQPAAGRPQSLGRKPCPASVHRRRDHRQGHRVPVRLGGPGARRRRHGDPAVLRSLRPLRRQQRHQAGPGDGEVEPGVDGGHRAVAVRRALEADQGLHDHRPC